MLNKTIESLGSDLDFAIFIEKNFKKPVEIKSAKIGYFERRMPKIELEKLPETEKNRILERSLIRDNIYKKYNFDIFEYPFIVFYEDEKGKKLKKFKLHKDAGQYSESLLDIGIYSLLISIMNYDIECERFT